MVQVLSHDLVSSFDGLELLVAGKDGTLTCLGVKLKAVELRVKFDISENIEYNWPSETKGTNGFTFEDGKV